MLGTRVLSWISPSDLHFILDAVGVNVIVLSQSIQLVGTSIFPFFLNVGSTSVSGWLVVQHNSLIVRMIENVTAFSWLIVLPQVVMCRPGPAQKPRLWPGLDGPRLSKISGQAPTDGSRLGPAWAAARPQLTTASIIISIPSKD